MRTHKTIGLAALALISGLATQQGMAGPVFVNFEGVLTFTEDNLAQYVSAYGGPNFEPLDPSIVVGASFAGSFSYDPATDPIGTSQNSAYYSIGNTMTGFVGSVAFESNPEVRVTVGNDPAIDFFLIAGESDGQATGLPFDHWEINLYGDPTAFDSNSLPTTIDLADFFLLDQSFFMSVWADDGDAPWALTLVEGRITSMTIVPEPGTLSLLALGALLITTRRTFLR